MAQNASQKSWRPQTHSLIPDSNQGLPMNMFRHCTAKCSSHPIMQNSCYVDEDRSDKATKPLKHHRNRQNLQDRMRRWRSGHKIVPQHPLLPRRLLNHAINQHHCHVSLITIRHTIPGVRSKPRNTTQCRPVGHTSKRTRLITETVTEHASVVEQAESQATEDRGLVTELFASKV